MKAPCKECWDPVDKDGEELCDYCAMTPEQRVRYHKRATYYLLALVAFFLVVAGTTIYWEHIK